MTNAPPLPAPLWLVGCGNLGRAMLDGWLAAGMAAAGVVVIARTPRELPSGLAQVRDAAAAAALGPPAAVVLAVKPQQLGEAAAGLAPHVDRALLLSVLAGAPVATLEAALPGARVVRAIPNTAVRVRRGVTLLIATAAAPADRAAAETLMGALGETHWIEEGQADLATALTASAPAFLFRFIEALAAAGEAGGMAPAMARALALQTVAGAAALAAATARTPAELRLEVTSPNGMTQAGLAALDAGGAFTRLIEDSLRAAARRSAELGREAAR